MKKSLLKEKGLMCYAYTYTDMYIDIPTFHICVYTYKYIHIAVMPLSCFHLRGHPSGRLYMRISNLEYFPEEK